jgi:hypothetical protein
MATKAAVCQPCVVHQYHEIDFTGDEKVIFKMKI